MPRKVGPYAHDILENIGRIEGAVSSQSFAHFQRDWKLRFAVQRAIEIISEASRRLPAELKAGHPEIPWPSIAGMGNLLRHEYQSISDEVIWEVVQRDLPLLKIAVEAIAKALDE
jgi:uncharacterized protein with HEPN domain